MGVRPDLATLAGKTRAVYEEHGPAFDRQRPKNLHEKKWLDRFIELLPGNARVLEVGCGAGEPLIPYFLSKGLKVEGLDFAESMLGIARARFPDTIFHLADMCTMQLGKSFDGIIAWNSYFHLIREDQQAALRRFAAHLKPGGILMLTVGPEDGEVVGHVNGIEVYHASLSPRAYHAHLARLEVEVIDFVAEDPDCDLQTVLIGRKAD